MDITSYINYSNNLSLDCILNVLLYCNSYYALQCLKCCKYIRKLDTQYFWKLLCEREYEIKYIEFEPIKWNEKYLICNKLSKINKKLHLDYEIDELYMSTEFDLSRSQLTVIPNEICILTNVTWLFLDHNQLTSIPSELGMLHNLTWLYLNDNQLISIPSELGLLTKLTYLSLSNNKLTSIPSELGLLTKLISIYLNNNQLTSIPGELCALSNLSSIFLAGNQITAIPNELQKLPKLHVYLNKF